jgi:tetratricopeptide (TPR) repeat protein
MLYKARSELTPFLIALCAVLAGLVLIAAAGFAMLVLAEDAPSENSALPTLERWLDRLPARHEQRVRETAFAAAQRSDWASAVVWLSDLHSLRPEDNAVYAQLGLACLFYGQQLAQAGQFEPALIQLRAARIILPGQPSVERSYQATTQYLIGRESYRRGDWQSARRHLKLVHDLDRSFRDSAVLLYQAQYQIGLQQQATGRLLEARLEYEDLLRQYPGALEIEVRLAEIGPLLVAPRKRIVVSISKQKMQIYTNDQLLHTWVCSTGEPGRDTKPGHYKIQTKMPLAYSGAYDLDMPYWLGIYYAGSTENGIHGPPIQRANGQKMWSGLLGYRISFGCVILSDENVKTLYDWAPLGTPVDIVQ